jgi:hypothetical protein
MFIVLVIVHSAVGSSASGCEQITTRVLTCPTNKVPPPSFGVCTAFSTPGNLTVWTCRNWPESSQRRLTKPKI